MKRIYSMLPARFAQRLRNILEFDGGVADTHVFRANAAADGGVGPRYRPAPASMPQARIPQGPAARTYDIKYYSRDSRRTLELEPGYMLPDQTFLDAHTQQPAGLLMPQRVEKPVDGSPGSKVRNIILLVAVAPRGTRIVVQNPDVERYDRTGLRSAMTATTAAMRTELAKHRPTQLPLPVWTRDPSSAEWAASRAAAGLPPTPGRPLQKRIAPWAYTQVHDW